MTDDRWEDFRKTLPNAQMGLSEYVRKVVDELGVDSQEFKDLVELLGKEKLREIYRKGKK